MIVRDNKTEPLALCSATLILLVFTALSSFGWFKASLHESALGWSPLVFYTTLVCLFFFVVWVVQTPNRAAYWVGASFMLGTMPTIPLLSFFTEFIHIALFLFAVANWRSFSRRQFVHAMSDSKLKAYLLFMLIAITGVIVNFLLWGDVWQIKVGLSQLIMHAIFFLVLFQLIVLEDLAIRGQLLVGFLDSLIITTILGAIVTLGILALPYSQGVNDDGRGTIFGLGYFDRLKLFFDGPGVAGCYFVVGMSLTIYVLSIKDGVWSNARTSALLFSIQIMPWLVIASGSRFARLAMVAVIVLGLYRKFSRKVVLMALPSSVLALLVGMGAQSILSAVKFWSHYFSIDIYFSEATAMSFDGDSLEFRFFDFGERAALVNQTIVILKTSPWTQKILGMGLGVAGFSGSPYPSPHNQFMDLLVEVGWLGAMSYFLFWLMCWRDLCRLSKNSTDELLELRWALFAGMIAVVGLFVSYEASLRGIVLSFLMLLVVLPRTKVAF